MRQHIRICHSLHSRAVAECVRSGRVPFRAMDMNPAAPASPHACGISSPSQPASGPSGPTGSASGAAASPRQGADLSGWSAEELSTLNALQGQFSNLHVRNLIDEGASSQVPPPATSPPVQLRAGCMAALPLAPPPSLPQSGLRERLGSLRLHH